MKTWRIAGAIVGISIIVFGYYVLSPLFRNVRVDEALPESKRMEVQTKEDPQPQAVSTSVVGTTGHPASGTARIVEVDDKTYIRYENFKTINGPDLYVYLATDLEAKEFVNLGTLKATEGNVNYEIPAGTDISKYRYTLVWCKAFGVLFNYADISR